MLYCYDVGIGVFIRSYVALVIPPDKKLTQSYTYLRFLR